MNDPLGPAKARAPEHRQRLAEAAAPLLSAGEVADRLGIPSEAITSLREASLILGVRATTEWLYTELQIMDGQLLPRLGEVLQAHGSIDEWVVLDSLLAKDTAYGNRNLIELLRDRDDRLLDLAVRDLERFYRS